MNFLKTSAWISELFAAEQASIFIPFPMNGASCSMYSSFGRGASERRSSEFRWEEEGESCGKAFEVRCCWWWLTLK